MADKKDTDKATDEATGKADDKEAKTGADAGAKTGADDKPKTDEPTYTQADLDRHISKAYEKWKEDHDAEVAEIERKAEQKRLAEAGQFKDLYEKTQAELDTMRAKAKQAEFREAAAAALTELDLIEFAPILLAPRNSVELVKQHGQQLRATINERVKKEVAAALDTGKSPPGGTPDKSKEASGTLEYPTMK